MCSKCTTIDTGNTHNEHFFSSTDGGDNKVRCNTGENPRSTVLYPSCKKVSDLTEEKLIAIAIRTRLSVQGYVQSVAYQSCSIVCLCFYLSIHLP